ncbi:unnamed protein product, partial [Chrysoparadoxa australica]
MILTQRMIMSLELDAIHRAYEHQTPYQKVGKVVANNGTVYEVNLARAVIGANVEFVTEYGNRSLGEVVGIKGNRCLAMPYDELPGINSETRVYLKDLTTMLKISEDMLGRVLDFQGRPIDDGPEIDGEMEVRSIFGTQLNPLQRPPISEPLDTGIHAINCFMTAGKGQRMAIMAGSGVGKSVTMGMIAKNTNADVNVIALIGERGR